MNNHLKGISDFNPCTGILTDHKNQKHPAHINKIDNSNLITPIPSNDNHQEVNNGSLISQRTASLHVNPTKIFLKKWHYQQSNDELHSAAINKDSTAEEIINLLDNADPMYQNHAGNTFIHIICEDRDSTLLKEILGHLQKIYKDKLVKILDIKNNKDRTALHIATRRNSRNKIILLLKNNASLNIPDSLGYTAIHWACTKDNNTNALNTLLKQADIMLIPEDKHKLLEHEDKNGNTALFHAVVSDQIGKAESLLKHNAKIDTVNPNTNESLLHIACLNDSERMLRTLINSSNNPAQENITQVSSCENEDSQKFQTGMMNLSLKKANTNRPELSESSVSTYSFESNLPQNEKPVSINLPEQQKSKRFPEIMKKDFIQLLKMTDIDGYTPLLYSVICENQDIMKACLSYYDSAEIYTGGETILHHICRIGNSSLLSTFLDSFSAKEISRVVNLPTHDTGYSALLDFIDRYPDDQPKDANYYEIINLLMTHGAEPNKGDSSNRTLSYVVARKYQCYYLEQQIEELRADISSMETAIFIRELKVKNTKINKQNIEGLISATDHAKKSLEELLQTKKARLDSIKSLKKYFDKKYPGRVAWNSETKFRVGIRFTKVPVSGGGSTYSSSLLSETIDLTPDTHKPLFIDTDSQNSSDSDYMFTLEDMRSDDDNDSNYVESDPEANPNIGPGPAPDNDSSMDYQNPCYEEETFSKMDFMISNTVKQHDHFTDDGNEADIEDE
ncbi:ankyrin repeat domain-containing protein [Endozoicomonas sp.]|uniref:ankyrin repeat domain-containing protein n=1 Tax=Endozoicomonas sp. TaxID=1892382 RepID=UPI0028868A77|nr:ankyrin repeat domain-containing protein [Endozoicomonas sp.]